MARTIAIEPLIEAIRQLQDDETILSFYEQLGMVVEGYVHQLSIEEAAELQVAQEQIDRGEFTSHEDVMVEAEKWVRESFGPK